MYLIDDLADAAIEAINHAAMQKCPIDELAHYYSKSLEGNSGGA